MSYHFSKIVNMAFEEAIDKVTEELKKEGFGIITEIDVTSTLKNKINVDFRNYRILGACNPSYAHEALLAEDKIGVMLPCNVVVQEKEDGSIEVSAIDPIASMQAIQNESLGGIATKVQTKLKQVIDNV